MGPYFRNWWYYDDTPVVINRGPRNPNNHTNHRGRPNKQFRNRMTRLMNKR